MTDEAPRRVRIAPGRLFFSFAVIPDCTKGKGWQTMARTKFTFEKRQREIARQQKQKDKAARRAEAKQSKDESEPETQSGEPGVGDVGDPLPASEENPGHGDRSPR